MTLPRFYPILDIDTLNRRECQPAEFAEALLEGGARILQFRLKGHLSRGAFGIAEQIAAMCREAGALFVVNDRADLAVLLDAGLHVGQEDMDPREARNLIGAGRVLGFSTHNRMQLEEGDREPTDYLALGPIYATTSKVNPDPVLGVRALHDLRGITKQPLVAIGGISRVNALAALSAGADSVAVIGDLFPEACAKEHIRARAEEWVALVEG
ncbi:MAG: thiamine phosphate synthase [Bryobacteraceae bacterium]